MSSSVWSRFRATMRGAATAFANFFGGRTANPPVESELSDTSSLTPSEGQRVRDAVRAELQSGYEEVNEHLNAVRREIMEMEEQSEINALETANLVQRAEGADKPVLPRRAAAEDLTIYSTPAGLDVIPEEGGDELHTVYSTPDWEIGGSPADEEEGHLSLEPAQGRVRFEGLATPLRRTPSIRRGDRGRSRVRGTPYHPVSRVLDLDVQDPAPEAELQSSVLEVPDGDLAPVDELQAVDPGANDEQGQNQPDGYN